MMQPPQREGPLLIEFSPEESRNQAIKHWCWEGSGECLPRLGGLILITLLTVQSATACVNPKCKPMQTKTLLISIKGLKWGEMKFSFSSVWVTSIIWSSWLFFVQGRVSYLRASERGGAWLQITDVHSGSRWCRKEMESWWTGSPKIPRIKSERRSKTRSTLLSQIFWSRCVVSWQM